MSYTLPAGGSLAIASTYGTAVTMSAITNATEAVATLAAGHNVVVGDILEVTSGWELLNNRVVRVKTVSTNSITFENINTTSTTFYPAGEGVGSVRRITAFTTITQVGAIAFSGGDQQFEDTSSVFGRTDTQMPATRTPVVAVTASALEDDRQAILDCGVDAFLSKPVDRAQLKQAELAYRRVVLQAYREVADVLIVTDQVRDFIAQSQTRVGAAREVLRLQRMRYRAGVVSFLEVLDAERQLFLAEIELARANLSQLEAYAELYRALGGGWSDQELARLTTLSQAR
jgi:DNA-binding NarL/FixJ family response regulator